MTLPRRCLIDPEATLYYHCLSRCVRRAFLCGKDPFTGFNFEHRRQWIEDRLHFLSRVFAIHLCGYAVMSNHYHVVLRIDLDKANGWSKDEVVERWSLLHRPPGWFRIARENGGEETRARMAEVIELWRERLTSISWYMRSVNEPLARVANQEDGCTGRFWEGRFKSQALLDEEALLKCLVYVDLNPIRAGMATTGESSQHTSIKARIEGRDVALLPMRSDHLEDRVTLPISRSDYIELVDWTGRQWQEGKPGFVNPNYPPLLEDFDSPIEDWLDNLRHLMKRYSRAIGSVSSLLRYRDHIGQRRLRGLRV